MATTTLYASQDTYYGTAYYAGPNNTDTIMHYGGWGDAQYDYIQFDLSSLAGATITAATLYMYNGGPSVNNPSVQVRRVTSSWSASTLTRTNHPTNDTTNWGSLGWAATAGWVTADITTLVQDWVNGTYSNYGLVLWPTVTSNQNNGSYDSSRGTNPEYLYVTYTAGTTTTAITKGMGYSVKAKHAITKGAQYEVVTAAGITKGAAYDVTTQDYTRGVAASLPSNAADLGTTYSTTERGHVNSNDGTYVAEAATGSEHVLHQFKRRLPSNADPIHVKWIGKSKLAPAHKTAYLQIYNQNTSAWETLTSNSSAAVDTDFTLEATQSSNVSHYCDANNEVAVRVYQ